MALKQNPGHRIVYGGPLPSSVPELLLKKSSCHYIVAGEGERSFPNLIESLKNGIEYPQDINGIFFLKEGVLFGKPNDKIMQLNELSKPDFSLFDIDFYVNYLKETDQSFELMASRGCVGNCSFCYKFLGRGYSIRPPNSVLDEISYIRDHHGINKFYFVDENFIHSKKFFYEFIQKKIKRKMDFSFIAQGRIDAIDEKLCKIGAENGLICISTGIESASQETLDRISKNITIEEIEAKMRLMRDCKIKVAANFIVGFPWDTENDYKLMIRFIEKNELSQQSKISYLTPLPKTRIYIDLLQKGIIKDEYEFIKSLGNLYWECMINLTTMPDDVLDHYYSLLYQIGQRYIVPPKSEKYTSKLIDFGKDSNIEAD